MKRSLVAFLIFIGTCSAQNFTTITASNIQSAGQVALATGQITFLATDNTDTPMTFQAGGGGQVIKRAVVCTVSGGAITGTCKVANTALTTPANIFYRVQVIDTSTGQPVITDPYVQPFGSSWSFDAYTPSSGGPYFPPSGASAAANSCYCTPNGSAGQALFRLLVNADLPAVLTGKTIDTASSNVIKVNGNTLSATAGTATVTVPNSTDTLANLTGAQTLANKTLASPVVNGSPSGTGIQTTVLKQGSGSGTAYSTNSSGLTAVDATNLSYTVTIPTGWKLLITAYGCISNGAAMSANTTQFAIVDSTTLQTLGNVVSLNLATNSFEGSCTAVSVPALLSGPITSHTIQLQFATDNSGFTTYLQNGIHEDVPYMTFLLAPSN